MKGLLSFFVDLVVKRITKLVLVPTQHRNCETPNNIRGSGKINLEEKKKEKTKTYQ